MKLSGWTPIKKRTVPRGGWLCFGLILGGLCFPGWGWSASPPSPAPPPEPLVGPPAAAQAGSAQDAAIGPETASPPESAEETLWLPLREVIQQYSETTGNRVRIKDDAIFDQLYSVNDPSWLEDFSRIEIFNEQTGKKEIILLGRAGAQPPAGPRLNARIPRKQPRKKIFRQGQGGAQQRRAVNPRDPFRRHK